MVQRYGPSLSRPSGAACLLGCCPWACAHGYSCLARSGPIKSGRDCGTAWRLGRTRQSRCSAAHGVSAPVSIHADIVTRGESVARKMHGLGKARGTCNPLWPLRAISPRGREVKAVPLSTVNGPPACAKASAWPVACCLLQRFSACCGGPRSDIKDSGDKRMTPIRQHNALDLALLLGLLLR
jgi:hypothetical protein